MIESMNSEEIASLDLTQKEIQDFQETGYHIHGRVFTRTETEALRAACVEVCNGIYSTRIEPDERYWNPGDDPTAMHKIDNCWKANDTIREAVTSPRLGKIAAQLIGAKGIRLWHDQLSLKPAHGGKVATWHQDWSYWQMIAECETVSCWIALDDVTPEGGPMVYWEGSHKLGLYPHPDTITGDDELKPNSPEFARLKEVPVIVPAGYVAFHHGLTLHGSGKNWTPQERGAIVSHVMSTACHYREKNLHRNESAMHKYDEYPKEGELFHGPQFPMMWGE
jgi:ectoine hydroxylase-related dioxygenase (phytanoyl-CoA dioxygenase family)